MRGVELAGTSQSDSYSSGDWFSLRTYTPKGHQESIGDPHAPNVGVAGRTELSAAAGRCLQPVVKEIVDPKLSFARIPGRQVPLRGCNPASRPGKELLSAPCQFRPAHRLLPEMHLA